MTKKYFVYIMMSKFGTMYIGVTNNIYQRVISHKEGTGSFFTKKYRCFSLVYFEEFMGVIYAVERERQLKKWSRKKKLNLIKIQNPKFSDLFLTYIE